MKDKSQMSFLVQTRKVVTDVLIASAVLCFVQLLAFSWMFEKSVLSKIAGSVFTFVYFMMIYSASGSAAKHDNKSYTKLSPDKRKGVFFGVILALITLILFLAYKFVWAKFGSDNSLNNLGAIAVNALFLFWTFPYFGLMDPVNGTITWYSAVLMFFVPIASATLGYIAVCNKFDITEKLMSFVYVKKEE